MCNACKEKGTCVRFISVRIHQMGWTFDPFGTKKCSDPSCNRSFVVKLKLNEKALLLSNQISLRYCILSVPLLPTGFA